MPNKASATQTGKDSTGRDGAEDDECADEDKDEDDEDENGDEEDIDGDEDDEESVEVVAGAEPTALETDESVMDVEFELSGADDSID
jgi:hypothetical protein